MTKQPNPPNTGPTTTTSPSNEGAFPAAQYTRLLREATQSLETITRTEDISLSSLRRIRAIQDLTRRLARDLENQQ